MGASVSGIVDLLGATFIVARDGRIEYLAGEGRGLATSELSAETLDKVRADIAARVSIELEVSVDIADNAGKSVAAAAFTTVIRSRRS
jgi:GTP cyclohydrolase III